MNGYNFTERVRKVLRWRGRKRRVSTTSTSGTEHILLGLIREGEGVAAAVLQNLNVDLDEMQQKIEETVQEGQSGRRRPAPISPIPRGPRRCSSWRWARPGS